MARKYSGTDGIPQTEVKATNTDENGLGAQLAVESNRQGYMPADVARALAGKPEIWSTFLRITAEIAEILEAAGITPCRNEVSTGPETNRKPLTGIIGEIAIAGADNGMSVKEIAAALFNCNPSFIESVLDGTAVAAQPGDSEPPLDEQGLQLFEEIRALRGVPPLGPLIDLLNMQQPSKKVTSAAAPKKRSTPKRKPAPRRQTNTSEKKPKDTPNPPDPQQVIGRVLTLTPFLRPADIAEALKITLAEVEDIQRRLRSNNYNSSS